MLLNPMGDIPSPLKQTKIQASSQSAVIWIRVCNEILNGKLSMHVCLAFRII